MKEYRESALHHELGAEGTSPPAAASLCVFLLEGSGHFRTVVSLWSVIYYKSGERLAQ